MLRWVNNYNTEIQEIRDNIDLIRIQEKYEAEKSTRLEIVQAKKENMKSQMTRTSP